MIIKSFSPTMKFENKCRRKRLYPRILKASSFYHSKIFPIRAQITQLTAAERRRVWTNISGIVKRLDHLRAAFVRGDENRGRQQRKKCMYMHNIGLIFETYFSNIAICLSRP